MNNLNKFGISYLQKSFNVSNLEKKERKDLIKTVILMQTNVYRIIHRDEGECLNN